MNYQNMPRNILISTRNKNVSKKINKYNNFEIQDMKFSEKEGKIKMNIIKNLDFNSLFETKNNILFQKIMDNLISSKLFNSDYDDIHKFLLLKSFQNSLEYLFSKKKKITQENKELKSNIDKILKKTNDIEKELNDNNNIIEENSKIKKEQKSKYEGIKKKYEEMKEKQEKKSQNDIKIDIIKVEKNIVEIKQIENNNNINKDIKSNKKYLCPVCRDKFFSTKEYVNNHVFRRHPKEYKNIIKNQKLSKIEKKDFISYLKEIEKLENYIKELIEWNNKLKEKDKYAVELEKLKKNHEKIEVFEKNQKEKEEEILNILDNQLKKQYEAYNNLLISLGLEKENDEAKIEKEKKKEKN